MNDEATQADRRLMRRALALAERGWGRVHPNPLVGAVVARDGETVGEGFHAEYGGPHAEAAALEVAGERARGATLYVTLEPCAHEGKTPPCTTAVRKAGIRRVVYAAADPGAETGGGAERLRRAGLDVIGGVEREAARRQNAAFIHVAETGTPYTALKLALSLDARIAARAGEATALTGHAAREEVQRIRAGFDAVLVGIGTALVDDPLLTVRGPVEPRVPPARVVVDTEARLRPESRLVRTIDQAPVIVLCAEDARSQGRSALDGAGTRTLSIPRGADGLDLNVALDRLWGEGIQRILCEGGGRVAASLLRTARVGRMYLFYAARLLGAAGVPAFPGDVVPRGQSGWRHVSSRTYGPDTLITLDHPD